MDALEQPFVVVGNLSDSYFAIDTADFLHQQSDVSDLVSLKLFTNSEFCPRFTLDDEEEIGLTGRMLEGRTLIIVSVHRGHVTRNELAMRNLILARAGKDNGAKQVFLVEPDLFYSAQDRGPRPEHGHPSFERDQADRHKFNGQPFTARLYAQLLKTAGVDCVLTIHNHSSSTQHEYREVFGEDNFVNMVPDRIFNYYLKHTDIVDSTETVLVAPDQGALPFVKAVANANGQDFPVISLEKIRTDERKVAVSQHHNSPYPITHVKGRDVVVMDDMVRTGGTIATVCRLLKEYEPRRIVFMVTHFLSNEEIKQQLSTPAINEIITTSTLPSILNRDNQGRLRKKMAVLKVSKWIASYINERLGLGLDISAPLYVEDMSDKNPRSQARTFHS
ncbi:MAG: ribose-phosphate diphosphokinase [Verrucomicrobiota bacterium]